MPVNLDRVADEWRLLRLEKGLKSEDSEGNPLHVDHYWREIFKIKDAANEQKYKYLAEVVKAAHALSHASAEIERGFSSSGLILTPDKAKMEERTLNAKLNIKSGMKRFGDKPELVPIGQKLPSLARSAHQSYEDYLEKERKGRERAKEKAEEEERLRREELLRKQNKASGYIASLEKELDRAQKDLNSKQSAAAALLKHSNTSLKESLASNNLEGIRTAQGMLEGANVMKMDTSEAAKRVEEHRKKLEKRKSSLISSLLEKRPRGLTE